MPHASTDGCIGSGYLRPFRVYFRLVMTRPALEVNSASIVLTGSFNPAIFQPQWFVRQNLLPKEEGDKAEIRVVSPQVCEFQTERFIIQVTTDRFAALSKPDANPAPLREKLEGRVGMRALLVQAEVPGFPDSTQETRLTVKVEPSARVRPGVYFQTNEHYQLPKSGTSDTPSVGSEYLINRIRNRWEGAYNYAAEIAEYILAWASK